MNRFLILLFFLPFWCFSKTIKVGIKESITSIKKAVEIAKPWDTILVSEGNYKEGNISINKPIFLIGIGRPVIDGERKYEIFSLRSNYITIKGFKIINSGEDVLKNLGAIRLYDSHFSTIENNIFESNYFGIYVQRGFQCLIRYNTFFTYRSTSQEGVGDGIHVWQSEEIWIINNRISGPRDGIYLEKVSKSYIKGNYSKKNLRYGLHFMFSNDDVYADNIFDNNNAGVAVMYSMNVGMAGNKFINNWGDAAYGLLLKDISFSKIKDNVFDNNTTGIYLDGATKIDFYKNEFRNNGWGLKISANCMENRIKSNNFLNNTFDVSTNGSTVMNTFSMNYWDKYEGYDLNHDGIGDVAFHPLSFYAVITEQNPSVMLLFKSFFVDFLDRIEKIVPSLTPENFMDEKPSMKAIPIKT